MVNQMLECKKDVDAPLILQPYIMALVLHTIRDFHGVWGHSWGLHTISRSGVLHVVRLISIDARDSKAPFSRYALFHLSFILYGPHFSFTWNNVFILSLLMSDCLGLVPSEVILYGRPMPPAMVPPLLRTYDDASASSSTTTGNLLVFHSSWVIVDTIYHVLRDPTFLSRSRGLSSVGGTSIPLT